MNNYSGKINQNDRKETESRCLSGVDLHLNTDRGTQQIIRGVGVGEKSHLAHQRVVVREVKTS